jgi:4-hydroxybenzoate polyprenyltransferase
MTALTFLKLIRAPAGFTAISNILAASIIASSNQLDSSLILLITASVLFYFSGMALNDCFDYKEDLVERPQRPIPNGDLSLKSAWVIGFTLMFTGLIFAFCYSTTSGYIGLALSTVIILYNGYIKQGLMGSVCMASCRYFNWILGASFVALSVNSLSLALPIFFYITGLTFLSKQETHGRDKSAVFFCASMIVLTALSALYLVLDIFMLSEQQQAISAMLIVIWFAMMASKLIKVFKQFEPQNIQQLIGWMVIGVIPLDALLVALSGEYIFSLIILALLPPCRMLNKYLYVT